MVDMIKTEPYSYRQLIPGLVAPFSRLIDPRTGLLSQDDLDNIAAFYEATPHTDLSLDSYVIDEAPGFRRNRLLHLPLRLALGLHPSVHREPDVLDAKFITAVYVNEHPISISAGTIYDYKKETIARLTCGSVLEAALDMSAFPPGYLNSLPRALRREQLIDSAAARTLRHAIEITTINKS